jgi:hypothetical protein
MSQVVSTAKMTGKEIVALAVTATIVGATSVAAAPLVPILVGVGVAHGAAHFIAHLIIHHALSKIEKMGEKHMEHGKEVIMYTEEQLITWINETDTLSNILEACTSEDISSEYIELVKLKFIIMKIYMLDHTLRSQTKDEVVPPQDRKNNVVGIWASIFKEGRVKCDPAKLPGKYNLSENDNCSDVSFECCKEFLTKILTEKSNKYISLYNRLNIKHKKCATCNGTGIIMIKGKQPLMRQELRHRNAFKTRPPPPVSGSPPSSPITEPDPSVSMDRGGLKLKKKHTKKKQTKKKQTKKKQTKKKQTKKKQTKKKPSIKL